MATVTLRQHQLDGALGPILVDVRSSTDGPAPAVMIHHGFKGFKDFAFLPKLGERLARAGFVAVNASVSGSGVDADQQFTHLDRFAVNTYSRELDDLGVVRDAILRGELGIAAPTSLGIVGHSRGGGMALLLARESPAIAAVVTLAAIGRARRHTDDQLAAWRDAGTITILNERTRQHLPLDYVVAQDCLANEHDRLDIAGAARAIGRPWLQVHGRADQSVPFAEAVELARHADRAWHETLFVDGADHGFGTRHPWAGPTEHSGQVFDAVTRFLTTHLA